MAESLLSENISVLPHDIRSLVESAQPASNVSISKSRSGFPVPVFRTGLRDRPLHSLISPEKESERYRPDENQNDRVYIVCVGLGAGYQLAALLDSPVVSGCLVIVPDIRIFRSVLSEIDLRSVLGHEKCDIILADALSHNDRNILAFYHTVSHGSLRVVQLRALRDVVPEKYDSAMDLVTRAADLISIDMATQRRFGHQWMRNTILNLPHIRPLEIDRPSTSRAGITAAGPSLETSYREINRLRKTGAILIATDTTYPALLSAGISPDYVITIDSQNMSLHHYRNPEDTGTTTVLALSSSPSLVARRRKKLFISTGHPLSMFFSSFGAAHYIDVSGGNVTYAAVSFAHELGLREITLFGADFSYPLGKPYASGTYVYPYLEASSNRATPLLTGVMKLVFRGRVTASHDPTGIRYTPELMDYYRRNVTAALNRQKTSATAIIGCSDFSWRSALSSYIETLVSLRISRTVSDTLSRLDGGRRLAAYSLFPSSLAYMQEGRTSLDSFIEARTSAVEFASRVYSIFS